MSYRISFAVLSCIVIICSLFHLCLECFESYQQKKKNQKSKKSIQPNNDDLDNHNNCQSNDCIVKPSETLKNKQTSSSNRCLASQFLFSFSIIYNTRTLVSSEARYEVVDTIRLVFTLFVYALQAFNFTFFITPQMLRGVLYTVPAEFVSGNEYWFARTPSAFIDGFMFTL